MRHGPKDIPAGTASTGEQKALLIGLILVQARLVRAMSGPRPLVLLDEVAAHLDPRRRAGLFAALEALDAQVWMTGADPSLFAELRGRADLLLIEPGQVERPSGRAALRVARPPAASRTAGGPPRGSRLRPGEGEAHVVRALERVEVEARRRRDAGLGEHAAQKATESFVKRATSA